ncbi:hypothetical protein ACVR0H_09075 [Streptococcus constellatus subsp. viborgensis]|uniref:hypothetical protein n=1 Tax=Streptococcus constellatus TaxID=76860 RepID=UPI0018E0F3A4|nr:hypothetical protein [Streptococcus constellatus]QQC22769.1 hypothetical protein I6H72_08620 [Streptococcus constellatus]
MEQPTFGSYHPRLGQKKEVLVRPVALVGSLNEFWFVLSTEMPISTSFSLLHRQGRPF